MSKQEPSKTCEMVLPGGIAGIPCGKPVRPFCSEHLDLLDKDENENMIEHNRCHNDNCDAFISGEDKFCNACVVAENNKRMKKFGDEGSYMSFGDIMEENGKTIRENRGALEHKYPVGTLVETTFEDWHSGGSCSVGIARMWVVSLDRDCDGSPLYSLSFHPPTCISGEAKTKIMLYYPEWEVGGPDHRNPGGLPGTMFNEEFSRKQVEKWKTGYPEESLKPIEVTHDIRSGVGCLTLSDIGLDKDARLE